MTDLFHFPAPPFDDEIEALRAEVRAFIAAETRDRPPGERTASWTGFDAGFSRKMGERGWIAMTWPKRYGGHELSSLHRYVVLEEMLAAGAPVGAHWIADRQSGPLLLRFGTEAQRTAVLPKIAAGECFFCIGMSEPDSGSDLASVRTQAVPVAGGFRLNGTKVWTSDGHRAHYMILFCRTSPAGGAARHEGLSQFLVKLDTPGITIRPIINIAGEHHFNEVVFEDVLVGEDAVIGSLGQGWHQVTSELALERSGPERFLSSFTLFVELVRALGDNPSERAAIAVGRLAAQFMTLRRLSRTVAAMLGAGRDASTEATIVKDLGSLLEQEVPELARLLIDEEPTLAGGGFAETLGRTILQVPSYSIRGGTREILRGIIARGLGLR